MTTILRTGFAFCLALLTFSSQLPAADLLAKRFLAGALDSNPGVASLRFQWESLSHRPTIAASLPDPELAYSYYLNSVQTRTGAMRQKISARQKIPFPGKLAAAKDEANFAAEIAYWQYRAALRDVFAQGKTLLADLYRADALILIVREQEALLRQAVQSAEALIETDQGSLGNVIRTQVAAEEMSTRIAQLEAERIGILARMSALAGQTEARPALSRYADPHLPALPSLDQLLNRAVTANPDLEAARATVARDQAAIRLATLAYYPDISLGLEYTDISANIINPTTPQNGSDPVMGTISINLPIWWDKLEAQKQVAIAQRGSSSAQQAQLAADISANVRAAHAMAQSMFTQRDRFASEIVPGTRQAYDSAQSAYSSGTASLTDLLDVQRAFLAAELGLVERTVGYLRAVAELERAIGEPLHPISTKNPLHSDHLP